MTHEEFFQTHQVDGVLSPEHMAQMLNLPPQGDTVVAAPAADDSSASPAAAPAPTAAPAPIPEPVASPPAAPAASPAPTPAPVILAKDGVHTIPYEKLTEAREAERVAREEAARLAAEIEALKKAQVSAPAAAPAPAATPAPAPDGTDVTFGDYSDEDLKKGVQQLVAQVVGPLQAELVTLRGKLGEAAKQQEVDATTVHWNAIYTAHPTLDSMLESAEFAQWKAAQPAYAQPGIDVTLQQGSAPEVIELFNAFTQATGKTPATTAPAPAPAAAPAPEADAAAKAAAAIAAARSPAPTSLSEIPAGSSAHHDEAAAMLEMTPTAVMAKFEGKSFEQIQAMLNRIL